MRRHKTSLQFFPCHHSPVTMATVSFFFFFWNWRVAVGICIFSNVLYMLLTTVHLLIRVLVFSLFVFPPSYADCHAKGFTTTSHIIYMMMSMFHGSGAVAPKVMSLETLKQITNNFSKERELGHGAFGIVYKVSMHSFFFYSYLFLQHLVFILI